MPTFTTFQIQLCKLGLFIKKIITVNSYYSFFSSTSRLFLTATAADQQEIQENLDRKESKSENLL